MNKSWDLKQTSSSPDSMLWDSSQTQEVGGGVGVTGDFGHQMYLYMKEK